MKNKKLISLTLALIICSISFGRRCPCGSIAGGATYEYFVWEEEGECCESTAAQGFDGSITSWSYDKNGDPYITDYSEEPSADIQAICCEEV